MTGRADEPDVEPKAVVDWGDDVSPKVESLLEFWHSRVYNAFHHSEELRKRFDADEWDALDRRRLDADDLLDADDYEELKIYEDEIRRVQNGDSSVDSTHELDVAWCELLADADGGEPR